jgi:hypothetical protein
LWIRGTEKEMKQKAETNQVGAFGSDVRPHVLRGNYFPNGLVEIPEKFQTSFRKV